MLRQLAPVLCACICWCAEPRFSAQPGQISVGESTTLEWSLPSASNVFLIGIGPVDSAGSIRVEPQRTTTFTVVAETPSGLLTNSVLVDVKGTRGVDFPQDETQFRFPLSVERAAKSKAAFISRLHDVLQNDLGFSVRAFSPREGEVALMTNSGERADLLESAERRIRVRRISYRVLIEDHSSHVTCTVDSLIESQLRAEETWRKENREELYRRKGAELLARIKAIP